MKYTGTELSSTVLNLIVYISDTLLYYGKDNTANIKLSPGPEKIDYRVQLVIFISDSYDTSTKVFLSVQVKYKFLWFAFKKKQI